MRTSPVRARPTSSCSRSVARPNSATSSVCRVLADPGPEAAATRESAASTSSTVSEGAAAGGASPDSRTVTSARQPTPIRP